MATMKSLTSSSSSSPYERTYDVFISFRGEDTRRGFTRNLYLALRGKEVNAFMDDQVLEKGAEITPALDKAIQESRIALVIFSKNYAASTFCLEELAKIMECSKEKGMLVWPVFYHVNPAEVRHHQRGSYAEALAKHEGRNYEKRKIERWKLALEKAANLSGLHIKADSDRYEDEFIRDIIKDISEKIGQPKPYPGVEHLPDNRVHYNKDAKDKALASVYTRVPTNKILENKTSHNYNEVWDLKTLQIAFHHANKNDVAIHTITLSKESAVEDIINDLKSKVDLSHPRAELRLLGVSDHTIKKIFSLGEKIKNISDKYEIIRAEEIAEEEKSLGTDDKLIHVYHFKTYSAPNQKQIQNFGDPFFLVIHKHEKLTSIKLRIQKKLQVPYDEISQWKFASVRYDHDESLDVIRRPNSVSDRFKSGSTYGDWEQYLGLSHADNAPPKRSYAAN